MGRRTTRRSPRPTSCSRGTPYLKTKGSLSTTGYDQISSIDTPDPQTAVVHFKETYTDWPDVLGGFSGVILEKAEVPGPDRTSARRCRRRSRSPGGPWILKSFSKDQEVLTANTNYWDKDRIPKIKTVTFVPLPRRPRRSRRSRPARSRRSTRSRRPTTFRSAGQRDVKSLFGVTTQYENIWFNKKPGHPFADKNLRAAFIVRVRPCSKLLNDIVKPFDPTVELLNCAAWVPGVGNWCDNTEFADLKPDPTKVASFMAASGYAKDSSGIWAKGGKELTIKWMENTGNKRRADTQAEFIPLLEAGLQGRRRQLGRRHDVPAAAARR